MAMPLAVRDCVVMALTSILLTSPPALTNSTSSASSPPAPQTQDFTSWRNSTQGSHDLRGAHAASGTRQSSHMK
jgi:hypothetical protein